jgi:hypothetical protein
VAKPAPALAPEDVTNGEASPPDVLVEFKKEPLKLPPRAANPCPSAPDGASAEKEVTVDAKTLPLAGLYKYSFSGYQTLTVPGAPPQVVTINTHQTRAVAHVAQVDPNVFTYDSYKPGGGSTLELWHMQVKNNGVQANPSSGVGTISTPRVGEPERGVTLKGIESIDARTGNTASGSSPFQPATGLLLLPLPVSPGESFESVAVDRTRGRTMFFQGKVSQPLRMDVCGEYADAWLVEGDMQDTVEGNYHWVYAIAPQYGSLIFYERYEIASDATSPGMKLTYSLNQLKPSPLPAGF